VTEPDMPADAGMLKTADAVSEAVANKREGLLRRMLQKLSGSRCRTCDCYMPQAEGDNPLVGLCRLHPPIAVTNSTPVYDKEPDEGGVVKGMQQETRWMFPQTGAMDRCSWWTRFRPLYGILGERAPHVPWWGYAIAGAMLALGGLHVFG